MKNPKEIVESGYDKIYKTYHKQRRVGSIDVTKFSTNKKELNDLVRLLSKNSKILDVGCGNGPVAKFFTDKNFDVVGIDISRNMLKLARKNVPKAKFYKMDMTRIRFASNSFDVITCFYAVTHVPRRYHSKILNKFYKILKPNGYLLISVGMKDTKSWIEENWLGAEMYFSGFDKETNLKLIEKTGFKIIWSRAVGPESDRFLFVLAQKSKS